MGSLKARVMTPAGTRVNKVDVEVRPLIKKLAAEPPPVDPPAVDPPAVDPPAVDPPAQTRPRAPTKPRVATKTRAVGKSRLLGSPTPGKTVPGSPRKPSGMRFGSQRTRKTRP